MCPPRTMAQRGPREMLPIVNSISDGEKTPSCLGVIMD